MEKLRHFTGEPFELDRKREYFQPDAGYSQYTKPVGLWITPLGDDDWPTWCRSVDFAIGHLEHENAVELMADANVLVISDIDTFLEFEEKYKVIIGNRYNYATDRYGNIGIDWPRVTQDYAGIFIVPYLYEMRWDHEWYTTWDVSSGCVWDISAIENVYEVTKELTS
jgi:hypothetical protein